MLELSLLNGFDLRADTRPVTVARGSQRLLAFVGVSGGRATRQSLYAALWPESDRRRASGNLRSVLWRLPPPVRDAVTADGEEVRFAPEVDCDVTRLVTMVRELLDGGEPPRAASDLAILQHDLLPTWYDDWVLLERERLRQLRMHALERMAATLIARGRFGEAIDAALLAIAAEPLRETAHRRLIEAHLAEGNQSEAVRQYERYRELLDEALGATPSASLRALAFGQTTPP
jgi:DNA-binding SARP family transcriptional activator